jgi:predicted hydrocarbon binding protein
MTLNARVLELAFGQTLQRKLHDSSLGPREEGFEFRFETFQDLKASLVRIFGVSARIIIYDAGIDPGRRSYGRMARDSLSKEEALKLFVHRKASQNWGRIAIESIDWQTSSGRISVEDSFETRGMTGPLSKERSCDFLKGYVAGFFSELFDAEVVVKEERCVATGDARCEFAFSASP